MPEIRLVKKLNELSPNIIAVVNFPENQNYITPARGYIFNIHLKTIYNSVENAAEHFIERTKKIPASENQFILGFVKGRNCHKNKLIDSNNLERDIIYCEFEKSNNSKKFKTKPYLVKCNANSKLGSGEIQTTTPNINDDIVILWGLERILSRKLGFEEYINNFPKFPKELGLEYI